MQTIFMAGRWVNHFQHTGYGDELASWKNMSCIVEVDLEYPYQLHDLRNDYSLVPKSIKVKKVDKLNPTLNDKTMCVVHHQNLKLYKNFGLNITKINQRIKFKENAWLQKYINLNRKLRFEAKNEFEGDFFKLMINSVFRKTIYTYDIQSSIMNKYAKD